MSELSPVCSADTDGRHRLVALSGELTESIADKAKGEMQSWF